MIRRAFLIGTAATAIAAAWARVGGAVGIVKPPTLPRSLDASDHLDRMIRDGHRRLISEDAWKEAFPRATRILGQQNRGEIDPATAAGRMRAIHAEALRDPEPPREIPPLRADEVGVEEVTALLRRVIAGDATIEVKVPWKTVHHTYGGFTIDGWRFVGFRSSCGIKYVDNVVAPDGRSGTFDSFENREGNPVALLTDDEQDLLDDIIEAAPASCP